MDKYPYSEEEIRKANEAISGKSESKSGPSRGGNTISLIFYGLIIIAIAVFTFFYYNSLISLFASSSYRTVGLIALVISIVFFVYSISTGKDMKKSIAGSVLILILFTIAAFAYPYAAPHLSDSYDKIKSGNLLDGLLLPFQCLTGNEKCQQTFGEGVWETKTTQNIGANSVKIDTAKAIIEQGPFKLFVPLEVKTDMPLELRISCEGDGIQLEATPDTIQLEKSESLQQKSIICSGAGEVKKASIKMETSVTKEFSFPVWIGQGESQGQLNIRETGPYSINIGSADQQPFEAKVPISVEFEKLSDFTLNDITSFSMSSKDTKLNLECSDKVSNEKIAKDTKNGKYSFLCSLEPYYTSENPLKSFIDIKAVYTLQSHYNITLKS